MARYAIGDIQGCFKDLENLLDKIQFDPVSDQLWFTGDLVNRGPQSLETLRFVKSLGEQAITVLGNHDFHLLALWRQGKKRTFKRSDTLEAIFSAEDTTELLEWLRYRPLMHHDPISGFSMLHAGLPPQWDLHESLKYAAEVEGVLRGEQFDSFLNHMYGNKPKIWSEDLQGWDRQRYIVNCFCRLRYFKKDGELEFKEKRAPGYQSENLLPWFSLPHRLTRNNPLVFGHWSTLGLYQNYGVHGIDSGCLWGGALTALKIGDSGETSVISVKCQGEIRPK